MTEPPVGRLTAGPTGAYHRGDKEFFDFPMTPRLFEPLISTVSLVHVLQGCLLLTVPQAGAATPLWLLTLVAPAWLVGFLMIEASLVAFVQTWWAALPQYSFLTVACYGALLAISQGQYLDGTVISRAHILADQGIYIILAAFYPIAVWSRLHER